MRALIKPWLMLPVAVGMLSATHIWMSYMRNDISQQMQRLTAEKKSVDMEVSKLRLEIASLTRPERLRRLAADKLGMAAPRAMQVIRP
jgi:cell division protein FtsL